MEIPNNSFQSKRKPQEWSELRDVMKYYVLPKKTYTKPIIRLINNMGTLYPSISILKKWFTEFRFSRISTSKVERSESPTDVITPYRKGGPRIISWQIGEWVMHLLIVNIKHNLGVAQPYSGRAFRRFVDVEEIWIHHNISESKQQSKHCFSRVNCRRRNPIWVCHAPN